jgi:hypothetical protein
LFCTEYVPVPLVAEVQAVGPLSEVVPFGSVKSSSQKTPEQEAVVGTGAASRRNPKIKENKSRDKGVFIKID